MDFCQQQTLTDRKGSQSKRTNVIRKQLRWHPTKRKRLNGFENEVPGRKLAHALAPDVSCIITEFDVSQLYAADDAG